MTNVEFCSYNYKNYSHDRYDFKIQTYDEDIKCFIKFLLCIINSILKHLLKMKRKKEYINNIGTGHVTAH